jgi:hypothetical protein
MPLDPGRDWLAAGITGIPRQREWDAVASVHGPGAAGDEVEFVALGDGSYVVESESASVAPEELIEALTLEPPYRAVARRRDDVWAVGAVAIDVASLTHEPAGDDLELTWDGSRLALSIDSAPADPSRATALQRAAAARVDGAYAAHAHRLRGDLWEISVFAL